MDEKDVTLYINCKNDFVLTKVFEIILSILVNLNIFCRIDYKFKILEIQVQDDYVFFIRFIDMENYNSDFTDEKFKISDDEILKINETEKCYQIKFNYIFGDFLKGEKYV